MFLETRETTYKYIIHLFCIFVNATVEKILTLKQLCLMRGRFRNNRRAYNARNRDLAHVVTRMTIGTNCMLLILLNIERAFFAFRQVVLQINKFHGHALMVGGRKV